VLLFVVPLMRYLSPKGRAGFLVSAEAFPFPVLGFDGPRGFFFQLSPNFFN
jgi:hypothetical protein